MYTKASVYKTIALVHVFCCNLNNVIPSNKFFVMSIRSFNVFLRGNTLLLRVLICDELFVTLDVRGGGTHAS